MDYAAAIMGLFASFEGLSLDDDSLAASKPISSIHFALDHGESACAPKIIFKANIIKLDS